MLLMDDNAQPGEILPPEVPAATPLASSLALARRISRGAPSTDLQGLLHGPIGEAVAEAGGYADDAIAESTRTAYGQAWHHFADWCRGKNVDPDALPLNPVLVAAYLAALAKTHGASALRSRVAAIAYHHRRRGFVFLPTHPVLRETLSGIRRRHPRKVRPAAALCAPEIKQLLGVCPTDLAGPAGLAGLRDRALFLVGFAGAFRRSELVAIDRDHLRFEASTVIIHVPRSKRDQEGKGADVTLPRMRDAKTGAVSETCPVRALETWLARGKIRRGAVFRGITRHGTIEERLTPRALRLILLKRAASAKLTVHESERLSPHGLRAGFITEAYLAGALDEQVGAHVRHDDLRSTRGYRRRARITEDNPARLLDL
jgi:integrase